MKQTFSMLILLILNISALKSQFIEYDFSKMQNINSTELDEQIKPVKNGNIVLIQINNINTFLYKVEISGKKIELQTPIPSELQAIFRLSPEELAPEAEEAKKGAEESASGLNDMKALKKDPTNPQGLNDTLDLLITKCEQYIKEIHEVVEKITEAKFARMQLITLSMENYGSRKMSAMVDEANIPDENRLKMTYRKFEKLYYDVELLYQNAAIEAANDPSKNNKIKKASDKIELGFEMIEGEKLLLIIQDILILTKGLKNEKNFQVTSPPIQMEGDMVSYKVTVTPSRTHSLSPYKNPISWNVDIPSKGGWKADFSVGPTISFGENAKDSIFYFENNTVDTLLKGRANRNSVNPSLAAMMHFYPRTGKNAAYGFMFGVGAGYQSINDINLSLFLGGSIILGKSRKIMVSGGLSYLKVARLKQDEFELDENYSNKMISLPNVSERVFRPSPFLSVSYNITNRAEIN